MNIIVAGAGKVGLTVAEHLAAEKHSVTVIDTSDDILSKVSNQLDVMCVKGNCSSRGILTEAGALHADAVIAATDSDEINLLCCHCSHRMGVPFTVARVRSAEYAGDLENLKSDLGVSMLINPELAAAVEISRLLRFPNAANIDTFARGRVEIVSFHIQKDDFVAGQSLIALSPKIRDLSMLFCAVERGDTVHIPNGSFVLEQGDKVYVAGTPNGINQFFRQLGRNNHKVRSVFIIGGSRIAAYLIPLLEKLGMECKILERDAARCRRLAEEFPKAVIIHGDGTDPELLNEERLAHNDAFVALTDRDEDNLIISLYAHQLGVNKVVAKSNRQNYSSIARSAGVESVVSPKLTTADQILKSIRGMQNSMGTAMTSLYRIAEGQAEAMEFEAGPSTRNLGIPLKELSSKLKEGILIAVIVRGNQVIIPNGFTTLMAGDSVIVVTRGSRILDLNDIFTAGG